MYLNELLDELGIPYVQHGEHQHATSNFLQVDCPWCSPGSNRYRMGLHKSSHFANCWSCGSHSLYGTLRELLSDGTPLKTLGTLVKGLERERGSDPLPRGQVVLPVGLGPLKGVHKEFLRSRGVDPDEAVRLWGVQGIGLASKLRWRVWIPIHYQGEVVSWTTRSVSTSGSGPKYITASPDQERISGKDTLGGFDAARTAIIIVEGPLDRLRIGPGAVDTGGAAYSPAQVLMMSRFPVRYICYDMDETGMRQGEKLARALSGFPGKTCRVTLDAKDPGECSNKEIKQLRRLLK